MSWSRETHYIFVLLDPRADLIGRQIYSLVQDDAVSHAHVHVENMCYENESANTIETHVLFY